MSDFGGTLRRLRLEKGMSLTQLAEATKISKGHLSKVESGHRAASDLVARMCDRVLGTNGLLLAAVRQSEASFAGLTPALDVLPAPVSRPRHREDGFRSGVDVYTEQLRQIYTALRGMGHAMSPELVLPQALTAVETARQVLKSSSPGNKSGLQRLITEIMEYAGWMAQEAGQITLAKNLTEEAALLALHTGDRELPQWVFVRLADIALYQGDGHEIVSLTSRTLEWDGIEPSTRSTAWQRQAQGYALLGDRSNCLRALERAQAFHEASEARQEARTLGTTSVAHPIDMTRGWALVDLCFYEEAAAVLRKVISELPQKSVRSRVRFTARLALAYAYNGDADQACDAVRTALPDIQRVDSDTIRVDLRALADVLRRRWFRSVQVVDLLADLRPQLGGSGRLG